MRLILSEKAKKKSNATKKMAESECSNFHSIYWQAFRNQSGCLNKTHLRVKLNVRKCICRLSEANNNKEKVHNVET